MSVYVVDASVAAKWFTKEEHTEAAMAVLDPGSDRHAPDFLLLEMDSVFCTWIRHGSVSAPEADDLRARLRQYPIETHPFSSVLDRAYAIANQTRQSVYDCLYVALAAQLAAQMVTADRRLYDAVAGGPFAGHVVWVEDVQ
ncbi:MAG: type II toxin-antitoxin system VapC family toxin [Armatimonadota bacterium]|jgi:predicted nucleic acid-binding protein